MSPNPQTNVAPSTKPDSRNEQIVHLKKLNEELLKKLTPPVATLDLLLTIIIAQLEQENANLNKKIDLLTETIKNVQIKQTRFINTFNQNITTDEIETMDRSEESDTSCSSSLLDGSKASF